MLRTPNDGQIVNCEIVPYDYIEGEVIDIPFRRDCEFLLMPHRENGFENGSWVDVNIRYNQLRFTNEISKGYADTQKDGLINCDFVTHNKTKVNNLTHLIVGI